MVALDTSVLVEALAKPFKSQWNREKGPKGYDAALERVKAQKSSETERIFFDTDPKAWTLYFLVKYHKGRHYDGQSAAVRAIASLENLSIDERKRVAAGLLTVDIHSTVKEALEDLASRTRGSTKEPTRERTRKRRFEEEPELEATPETVSLSNGPSPTAVLDLSQPSQRPLSVALHAQESSTERNTALQSPEPVHAQTVSNPEVRWLPDVFPSFMCGAVRKRRGRAAITISFPYGTGSVACLMSLAIMPHKVDYVAAKLFDVHTETDQDHLFRYVVLDNGIKLLPRPELAIQGAGEEGIEKLLGSLISHAIEASPVREEEVLEAISTTNCVTMRLPGRFVDDATLNLNLELEEGFQIKDRLHI